MLLVTGPVPFCPLASFQGEHRCTAGEHCKDLRSLLVLRGSKTSVLSTLSKGLLIVSGTRVFPPELSPAPLTSPFVPPVAQPSRPLSACLLLHFAWSLCFAHVTCACSGRFSWGTQIPDSVSPNPKL